MSKIAKLDDYKMGKLKGKCTEMPEKEHLNTSDENYRRGYKVGKKAGSKDTLDNAFSDSARNQLKSLIVRYRKTKDSALFDRILAQYQSYIQAKGISDSTRSELKQLITQYRKTKDSNLYNQITSKFSNIKIKDEEDDNLVLLEGEDGDYVIAKKFVKEDLEGADNYLKDNPDKKIIGKDEDGGVLVTDKDDDDDVNEENTINEKDLKK